MSGPPRAARLIVLALLWLGAFAFLYTAGETLGIWPPPPPGAFRDWDLVAGALFFVAAVAVLAARRRPARP